MGELDLMTLRAGIVDKLRPGIVDQVSTVSVLMERLYYGRKGQGGERGKDARGAERYRAGDALWKLVGTGNKRSTRTDGSKSVVVATDFKAEKPFALTYGYRTGDILLYDADRSANNSGDKMFNLMATRIKNMTEGMMEDVAKDLFVGKKLKGANGGTVEQFDGLMEVVDDSNVYGTINRVVGENDFFRAKVVNHPENNSLLTIAKIEAMHDNLTVGRGNVRPTVQITTKILYRAAANQIRQTATYIEHDPALAERSIEHVVMNGSPVLADVDCPVGNWLHLNENSLVLYIDPMFDCSVSDWQPVSGMGIDANGNSVVGTVVHAQQLFTKIALCLYCDEPRSQGRHTGLTVAE